jgi:hypothetical protein
MRSVTPPAQPRLSVSVTPPQMPSVQHWPWAPQMVMHLAAQSAAYLALELVSPPRLQQLALPSAVKEALP